MRNLARENIEKYKRVESYNKLLAFTIGEGVSEIEFVYKPFKTIMRDYVFD